MIKNDNDVDDDMKCGVDDGDNAIDWCELLISMDELNMDLLLADSVGENRKQNRIDKIIIL